jgi:hypothetical protein
MQKAEDFWPVFGEHQDALRPVIVRNVKWNLSSKAMAHFPLRAVSLEGGRQ